MFSGLRAISIVLFFCFLKSYLLFPCELTIIYGINSFVLLCSCVPLVSSYTQNGQTRANLNAPSKSGAKKSLFQLTLNFFDLCTAKERLSSLLQMSLILIARSAAATCSSTFCNTSLLKSNAFNKLSLSFLSVI